MEKETIIRCFNDWAENWDAKQLIDAEKINRILDAAGVAAGDRVLDIACGTGVLTPFLLERGAASVLGVDIAEKMCRLARQKFSKEARVSFLCADAETVQLPQQFDCCLIFNAFPHFTDREALLWNLRQALVAGGRLTIAHDRGRAALDRHHMQVRGISSPLLPAEELKALLLECGYVEGSAMENEEIYIVTARNGGSL